MTRKKQSLLDDLFKFLLAAPWWAGPICVAVAYGFLRWLIPMVLEIGGQDNAATKTMVSTLAMMSVQVAPYAAGGVLLLWLFALLIKLMDRDRFESQTGLDSIGKLGWVQFERLLGEFYRRQGYQVEVTGSDSGDGGVDVRLRRDGKTTLVQCKHWQVRSVGVKPVRELLGVMTSENAHYGILVTSGSFTPDAVAFAEKNGIRLIDGPELEKMIRSVLQAGQPESAARQTASSPAVADSGAAPACPICGAAMKKRTASQGRHAGTQFWGCSRYPACKGIRQIQPAFEHRAS